MPASSSLPEQEQARQSMSWLEHGINGWTNRITPMSTHPDCVATCRPDRRLDGTLFSRADRVLPRPVVQLPESWARVVLLGMADEVALDRERQFVHAILGLTAMREARGATQRQVAEAWDVSQANGSQIEHTPDIYLSTLGKYVAALGGQIEIRAAFPDAAFTWVGEGSGD